MCRWFAYISETEPCLLEDVLVTPAHALSKQIHVHYLPKLLSHDPAVHTQSTTEAEITTRNRLFNVDGFGMVWYTPTFSSFSPTLTTPTLSPTLYKTIQPPLHDSNFRSICKNTSSPVVLAHIRAATATAITPTNNHPFTFGIWSIMHNGYISNFPLVKRAICEVMDGECYAHIQGGTDTEVFAGLVMSFLCPITSSCSKRDHDGKLKNEGERENGEPKEWYQHHEPQDLSTSLQKAIATVIDIQTQTLGSAAEPNDLNICLTDGKSLVACRYRNHPTEQPPSLYYSTTAGVTLNRKFPDHPDGKEGPHGASVNGQGGMNKDATQDEEEHGKHFIIASEPTTYKDREWTLIEKNHVVIVSKAGLYANYFMEVPKVKNILDLDAIYCSD